MESGTEYQLKLVVWDFFGSLTWNASHLGSARSREVQVWDFFRTWAKEIDCHLALLPIVLRWERGEVGDRPHAHFLLHQRNYRPAFVSQCFWHMHQWSSINGYGFARIRLYNAHHGMDDADYVSKCLDCTREHLRDCENRANAYEIGKFDYADRLVINKAARQLMFEAASTRKGALHPL